MQHLVCEEKLALASASPEAGGGTVPLRVPLCPLHNRFLSQSQMFCYLTEEIYTLLKRNKCFPPLWLPAGPTNDSGRASGGELHGTFFLTYNQLLGATAETVQITFLFHRRSLFFGRGWIDLKTKALFSAVVVLSCARSEAAHAPRRGTGTRGACEASPHGRLGSVRAKGLVTE